MNQWCEPPPPDPSPPGYYDVPYHMTTRPESPPPSPLFLCTYTVPRLHTLYSHPPISLCVWGGGRLNCNPQHTRLFDLCKRRRGGGPQHWRRIPAKSAILLNVGGHSGAPPSVEPLTYTNFICRYKEAYMAAGNSSPLQSSFCLVSHYPPPWCVRCFPGMGQRVNVNK